jgi:16S rRNA (adenine1518-N6/adenine1519-N6)-dimethyltransferase
LEVGPGIGTLSEARLARGVCLGAGEKDTRLLPPLAELAERFCGCFTYVQADAVELLEGLPVAGGAAGVGDGAGVAGAAAGATTLLTVATKLVSNLPYAVAATVVLACFQRLCNLTSATVMVQSEVAARMAAHPGTKEYGAYSVKLQLLARPSASFTVGPQSFLPPPRVSSTVIRLDRIPAADSLPDGDGSESLTVASRAERAAAELVRASFIADAAFAERRKTIRNSMRSYFLAHGFDPALVDLLLEKAGVNPRTRGETLTVEDYRTLGHLLRKHAPDMLPPSR